MHAEENGKHKEDRTNKPLLTKRETDIVILMCKELSDKQIAGELNISVYTVETHKKKIRNKTGSFTAVGVALYAVRNNIFVYALLLCMLSFLGEDLFEIFSSCISA